MGNALSASNPAVILPVENYLADLADNVESLGSTRFLKVARGRNTDTSLLSVFKVFVIQDESLALGSHKEQLLRIRDALIHAPNCSTIRKIYLKPDYAVLDRPFQKYTLSDRFCTRPFINCQERLWYIYQLFNALDQCDAAHVCHGDIKSQNIVLSSCNWLQLTDFASFKPTFLQHDNPSSFSFFFDTSRQQSCNLAPERFLSSSDYEHNLKIGGDVWLYGSLKSSMDMFAAGCVVYELLSDGRSPFSYGQLCDYRAMSVSDAAIFLEKLLSEVPHNFHPLLKMLLNREPTMRMTAKQVLDGTAFGFPSIMKYFFNYLNAFRPKDSSASHSMEDVGNSHSAFCYEPDVVISKLKRDKAKLWSKLEESQESRPFAVLLIPLITSNLRSLKSSQTKVDAMNLLIELSEFCDFSVSVERILPYLVFLLSDSQAAVRARAIHSIVVLTAPIEPSTVEDSLVFIDYLLPELTALMASEQKQICSTYALSSLAYNLGSIAQIAYRFLTVGRSLRDTADDDCSTAENISSVHQKNSDQFSLTKAIKDLFEGLRDSGAVIHCLVHPHSIAPLYSFFHKMGNGEYLLHHMITFLNKKSDWRLRVAFFDALPICLQKKSVNVVSLLIQGLDDFEELVVVRVMICISNMVAAGLLDRASTLEFLHDAAPFLVHPNEWIRACVVNLIVLLDSQWSLADRYCKLYREVYCYVKDAKENQFLRFSNKIAVLESLKEPISRDVWKKLITTLTIERARTLLAELERCVRQKCALAATDSWILKVFGSNCTDAGLLFNLSRFDQHLLKMAEFRRTVGLEAELTRQKGTVDLSAHKNVKRHEHNYQVRSVPDVHGANSDWREMFFGVDEPVGSNKAWRGSACSFELRGLLMHKEEVYMRSKYSMSSRREYQSHSVSKVNGTLVSHLHEHSKKVTQLAMNSDGQRFASCSLDGKLKVWNVETVTGECYAAARSVETSQLDSGAALHSIGWAGSNKIVLAAEDGSLVWADSSNSLCSLSKVDIPSCEGSPMQIHTDNNLVFVRTHHGVLYCLDSRVGKSNGPLRKHEVWRRTVFKSYGLVTSFCVDPVGSKWMTLGCTNNQLMLWDLRYQMEVASWAVLTNTSQNSATIPVHLWNNPCSSNESPEVFVALRERGDVSVYDLSKPARLRSHVLWPSFAPPFNYHSKGADALDLNNQTSALTVCRRTGTVYTGDLYGSLRKWSLTKSSDCSYLSGPLKEDRSSFAVGYEEIAASSRDPAVIREKKVSMTDTFSRPGHPLEGSTSTFHRTAISDLVCLGTDYIASSAVDGVIKVWK